MSGAGGKLASAKGPCGGPVRSASDHVHERTDQRPQTAQAVNSGCHCNCMEITLAHMPAQTGDLHAAPPGLRDPPNRRSPVALAKDLAHPGFMTLHAVRRHDRIVDFVWDSACPVARALLHQPGIDLLFKVIPLKNILFGSEMVGAVRGIDPETGDYYDDTKLYVDRLAISDADRKAVYEGNIHHVYPRIAKHLGA